MMKEGLERHEKDALNISQRMSLFHRIRANPESPKRAIAVGGGEPFRANWMRA
jgi:hypothetical protein